MMLSIPASRTHKFCDGISRRDFLRIGALALGGLSLAELLRLKAQGALSPEHAHKAVIMINLVGGPSHIDMYDMKPDAPAEYRGEFKPIKTNVPGIEICEHMPLQATIADKLAIVRGLRMAIGSGDHDSYETLSGYKRDIKPKRPVIGSLVSRLRGDGKEALPYVSLGSHRYGDGDEPETPAYLGGAHRPFAIAGPGMKNLQQLPAVSVERLQDRKRLLRAFDDWRSGVDSIGSLASHDVYTARALEMIASGKAAAAFDITREPREVQEKFKKVPDLLRARRLVEAGVSVVTIPLPCPSKLKGADDFSGWDTHSTNFEILKTKPPLLDHAVYTLVTDLAERGLDKDVSVLVWGEFGRTPRIGDPEGGATGRNRWPEASFALFAGGGLRMGQVAGQTDRRAERAKHVPFTAQNVLATLYHILGIDPGMQVPDFSGRPMYLLDDREPIKELVG
jgi:uncharacterized protein (DUF1501 family)